MRERMTGAVRGEMDATAAMGARGAKETVEEVPNQNKVNRLQKHNQQKSHNREGQIRTPKRASGRETSLNREGQMRTPRRAPGGEKSLNPEG